MKFDLHVHTLNSHDSSMSADELIDAAIAAGLSGVAICDHNSFRQHHGRDNFFIIPACEYSTDIGHLLVYFMKKKINASLARDDAGRYFWRDVCKAAHEQGALVFLAHPFSPAHNHPAELFEQIDGVEVFNSRVVHSRITDANSRALKLCKSLDLPFSAGSDAHCPEEVGTTFWECNLPEAELSAPDFSEKLKAAILGRKGRVYAGAADIYDVLRCKRRAYINLRMNSKLLKNLLQHIYVAITKRSKNKFCSGYINFNTEE